MNSAKMHLRSVIRGGGRETNLVDNCKSIREGGFTGCNSYPLYVGLARERIQINISQNILMQ